MLQKEKFILSYSGGKDSLLACFRAVQNGGRPIGAVTTFDRENACSWFHHLPETLLKSVSQSLGFPIRIIDTTAEHYVTDFENALKTFKLQGGESVVFGDIDIQEHYDWCDERCRKTGLRSVFPLWHGDRRSIVDEMIEAGFQAVFTTIDATKMPERFLGKTLTHEIVAQIADEGIDPCGENGEYHTFVYDGPLFRNKIEWTAGRPVKSGKYIRLPLT